MYDGLTETIERRTHLSAMHTDIVATGWVARLPRAWLPYLLLARVDRPIGTWLLFLPGLWGILLARAPVSRRRSAWSRCSLSAAWSCEPPAASSTTCGIATSTARWRAPPDGRSPRVRCGRARRWCSWRCCCWPGLVVLLQLNRLSQGLGVASLLLVGLYPLAKRVTWWPQLMMGFTFGFGAPMGYAAAAGRIDAAWVALYAAAILWDLGFDTIYAHQDREDDALVGVRSTARLFGERTTAVPGGVLRGGGRGAGPGRLAGGLGAWFYPALVLAGGAAGAAGGRAGHRRSRRLPAAVPRQPGGRAGGRPGDPAGLAVTVLFRVSSLDDGWQPRSFVWNQPSMNVFRDSSGSSIYPVTIVSHLIRIRPDWPSGRCCRPCRKS